MINLKREITEYALEYMKANEKKLNGLWSEYWEIYTSKNSFTWKIKHQKYAKNTSDNTYSHFKTKTVQDNATNFTFNAKNTKKLEELSEKFIKKFNEDVILELYANTQFTQKYNLQDEPTLRTVKSCLVNLLEEYIEYGNKNVNEFNNRKKLLQEQINNSEKKVEKMIMNYKNDSRNQWLIFFLISFLLFIILLITSLFLEGSDWERTMGLASSIGGLSCVVFVRFRYSYKSKKQKKKHYKKVTDILNSKTEYTEKEQSLLDAINADLNLSIALKKESDETSLLNNFINQVRNEY